MGSYTNTGPFTNGTSPGISAAFLNNIETWIGQVDNTTAVTVSGSTSGSVSLYQPLQGVIKMVVMYFSNYKDSGTHNLTLPVAFASGGIVITGGVGSASGGTDGGFTMRIGASDQTLQVITALAAGNAGSATNETFIAGYNIAQFQNAAIDTIHLAVASTAAHTGPVVIIGV